MELTILMPCLNESQTLATCINKAHRFLKENSIDGEVLIADNGSTDGSQKIAVENGARVVNIPVRGYGAALIGGTEAAKGKYIVMGDADDSYDFLNLMPFVSKLREGYELVMGNRFTGGIKPGAMPPLHKYFGNPVLTGIGRLLFKSKIKDFHCGLRAYNKAAMLALDLQTTGMEFASEMIVKATLNGLKIAEVPTVLSKDGRNRPPHLRSWRDGWRHLRFLLIFSPRWLFLYPGTTLLLIGLLGLGTLMVGSIRIGNYSLSINSMLYFGMFTIVGLQTIFFALFAKIYSIKMELMPCDPLFTKFIKFFSLEKCIVIGAILIFCGIIASIYALVQWHAVSFGLLDPLRMMRVVIPAVISFAIGVQITFSGFFLSILSLERKRSL